MNKISLLRFKDFLISCVYYTFFLKRNSKGVRIFIYLFYLLRLWVNSRQLKLFKTLSKNHFIERTCVPHNRVVPKHGSITHEPLTLATFPAKIHSSYLKYYGWRNYIFIYTTTAFNGPKVTLELHTINSHSHCSYTSPLHKVRIRTFNLLAVDSPAW